MQPNIFRLMVLGFFLMFWMPVDCLAQLVSSFTQLQVLVKPGDKIYVTDFAGRTTTGRIEELSQSKLSLIVAGARRDWLQTDVREIKQWRGDSLKNGALIGAATGGGITTVALAAICHDGGCEGDGGIIAGSIAVYTGIGAAVGVGIDALIPHKQTIFRNENRSAAKIQVRPVVNRLNRGVQVEFSF